MHSDTNGMGNFVKHQTAIYGTIQKKLVRTTAIVGLGAAAVASVYNGVFLEALDLEPLAVIVQLVAAAVLAPLLLPLGEWAHEAWGLVAVLYFCFVYTPVTWFETEGLFGSMPFVVTVFMMLLIFLLSRRTQRAVTLLYLLTIVLLMAWDVMAARADAQQLEHAFTNAFSCLVMIVVGMLIFGYLKRKFVEMSDAIHEMSHRDALTGLYNARYLKDVLEDWEQRYVNKQIDEYYIAMLDIDRFKQINDQYGHDHGDEVLRQVAAIMEEAAAPTCACGRYGGDEFLIIARDVTPNEMFEACERFRVAVRGTRFTERGLCVTVSIGLERRSNVLSKEEVFKNADLLMYQAKRQEAGKESTERRMEARE